jgi:hypothetical protein
MVTQEAALDILKLIVTDEEPRSSVRRAQRLGYTGPVHVGLKQIDEPVLTVFRDFSPRGMSFSWPQSIAHGSLVFAYLARPTGRPACVECQVVHCRPENGRFSIGVEFTRILNRGDNTPPRQ